MSLETERQTENVCRICLSSDNPKELIAPCICRGTVKYVHTTCLAQWRYRLVANGREEEIDSCTICKFKYVFKRKTTWGCILATRGARIAITMLLIFVLLLPCGYLMKLSMLITSPMYIKGINPITKNSTTTTPNIPSLEDSTTTFTTATTTTTTDTISVATPNHPFYPPICNCQPGKIITNKQQKIKKEFNNNDFPITNSFYPSVISNFPHFPSIMTAQFWFDFLCKPEIHHLHLGLFFLGSLNNVFTAYAMMSDVYDMMITENPRRKLKQVVLIYTSLFVACFWFHYNISAFRVASTQEFLQELPFWVLRWITVSMAIVDFGLRRIYWELDRLEFDDVEVISVQEVEF
ncbi:3132_t:CDS:2 [Ambispora leptoticha]|uniref:3132_t:CDS:1 n=1 Tax=Ambispora leptoticha TaxID=144679 RepID=A0A9N8Z325_9GLOM|nr:3132_t:CDS:2 [Ambispora leptoticha]